jgi:hypothetical protein
MFLNTRSTIGDGAPTLDTNFGMWPLDILKFVNLPNIFVAHLIFHFVSSGINFLLVVISGFIHQQLGHLQDLFMLFSSIITISIKF